MKKAYGNQNTMYSPSAIVDEYRDLLALAAGPRGWNDTRDSWLARGARALGVDFSRARNVWYGKTRRVEASEFLNLKARAEALRARHETNREAMNHVAGTVASASCGMASEPFGTTDEAGD